MKSVSRREFLRRLAAGATGVTGAWFLEACAKAQVLPPDQTNPPANTPFQPTQKYTDTSMPSKTAPTAAPSEGATQAPASSPTASPPPDLVVARGGQPDELVNRALAALGGIERFVHNGDDVILKPNICVASHSYEYAATTNPWVLAALVKLCLGAGASKVRVMDYPFNGTAEEAYARSGIREQVKSAGGEMAYMPGYRYVSTPIPQGKSLKKASIFEDILKAKVVINVPIAKTHDAAGLTLGMKNLMGVILDRSALHLNLDQRIADLNTFLKPALTIVDAVRILTAHGPTGGNLNDVKKLDTIIASADVVAADSYAASLFGKKPTDLGYIVAGAAMGLGVNDLSRLRIKEIAVGG